MKPSRYFFVLIFFSLLCGLVLAEPQKDKKILAAAGLVLDLPFEEGSTSIWTRDYSDYKNDGTVTGAYWNVTGGFDSKGAYQFDGDEDYIDVGSSNVLNTREEMTLLVWVKFKEIADGIIIAGGDGLESEDYYLGIYDSAGNPHKISFGVWETLSWTTVNWTTPQIDTWYHLAAVYNYSYLKLYVDGRLVDNNNLADEWPISIDYVRIGQLFSQNKASFKGTIDEVKIYNYALSSEQIRSLYDSSLAAANTAALKSPVSAGKPKRSVSLLNSFYRVRAPRR